MAAKVWKCWFMKDQDPKSPFNPYTWHSAQNIPIFIPLGWINGGCNGKDSNACKRLCTKGSAPQKGPHAPSGPVYKT